MSKRKLILFIATSLDGYIAGEEHQMDWLFNVEGEGDNGFSKFYDSIDTVLVGRTTYDWIIEYEKVDSIYNDKECYVFSRTERSSLNNTFINEDAAGFVRELKNKDGKDIWLVGGGDLIHTFIKENLVDELRVTVAPVLLGKGIPLFKKNDFQTSLLLKGVNQYKQLVELCYEVVKRPNP